MLIVERYVHRSFQRDALNVFDGISFGSEDIFSVNVSGAVADRVIYTDCVGDCVFFFDFVSVYAFVISIACGVNHIFDLSGGDIFGFSECDIQSDGASVCVRHYLCVCDSGRCDDLSDNFSFGHHFVISSV